MATHDGTGPVTRRAFLNRSALATGGSLLTLSALGRLHERTALAAAGRNLRGRGYGPLSPALPSNRHDIEAAGFPDLARFPILALPHGFQYRAFSIIGGTLSDGTPVPVNHDGMGAFAHPTDRGIVRLIRNQEDRRAPGAGSVLGPPETKYDPLGGGGNVSLDYDERRQRLVKDFISLNGTIINCAGGIGLGAQSWLTCEETTAGPPTWGQRHGYVFEVSVHTEPFHNPKSEPITAMGRFAHEAVAVDPRGGIVYLTEDAGSGVGSGLYRYLPNDPTRLSAGGRLQMLGIAGQPQTDLREGQTAGAGLPVEWFDILDPDPASAGSSSPTRCFNQGFNQGAAKFNRLEGCWWDASRSRRDDDDDDDNHSHSRSLARGGDHDHDDDDDDDGGRVAGSLFLVSTSGGNAKNGDVNSDGFREGYGQIWKYSPGGGPGGRLELAFESPGQHVLDSPDNLTVTPRGGLILCEDDSGSADNDTHPLAPGITDVNRLIGLSPRGEAFEFAVNRLNDTEFAGACFSPSGRTMFVNIFGDDTFGSGMTLAITGPWTAGPL